MHGHNFWDGSINQRGQMLFHPLSDACMAVATIAGEQAATLDQEVVLHSAGLMLKLGF